MSTEPRDLPYRRMGDCPDCGRVLSRHLRCGDHGRDCPLWICPDCGATVHDETLGAGSPRPRMEQQRLHGEALVALQDLEDRIHTDGALEGLGMEDIEALEDAVADIQTVIYEVQE